MSINYPKKKLCNYFRKLKKQGKGKGKRGDALFFPSCFLERGWKKMRWEEELSRSDDLRRERSIHNQIDSLMELIQETKDRKQKIVGLVKVLDLYDTLKMECYEIPPDKEILLLKKQLAELRLSEVKEKHTIDHQKEYENEEGYEIEE